MPEALARSRARKLSDILSQFLAMGVICGYGFLHKSCCRVLVRLHKEYKKWVVVKIMAPFGVPTIIRHKYLGYPKRDHNFDDHPKA